MIPEHFSRDITSRCARLIGKLWPHVANGGVAGSSLDGPLDVTFLLAMAMPMIIFPYERIFVVETRSSERLHRVGNDDLVTPELAERLRHALARRKFEDAPFAKSTVWSYVSGYPPFNIAETWSSRLVCKLEDSEARNHAQNALTKEIMKNLRNALAHGGVVYLNDEGRNTDGRVEYLAFVSIANSRHRLNILRVSVGDFRTFLKNWADWIKEPK